MDIDIKSPGPFGPCSLIIRRLILVTKFLFRIKIKPYERPPNIDEIKMGGMSQAELWKYYGDILAQGFTDGMDKTSQKIYGQMFIREGLDSLYKGIDNVGLMDDKEEKGENDS